MIEKQEQMQRLTRAYIGPNKAHQQFVQKITNEKTFVFLIMNNKKSLFSTFQDKIESARQRSRKMGNQEFAIGIVTKGISTTQFKGIHIRENESTLIAKDFKELEAQVYGKSFAELHRIFVDYQVDLYREILQKCPSFPKHDNLSYKATRQKAFDEIALPILPNRNIGGSTPKELEIRLNELESIRHLIEHNNGVVDQQFLQRNAGSSLHIGDRVSIEPEQIGEAIALVETLAEDLNKRATGKYHLG